MVVLLCLGQNGERCNVRVVDGSYCAEHQPAWRRRRKTEDPRRLYAWQKARRRAKRRDRRRCTVCGSRESLSVHHRNGDPSDHRRDNLVTLCADCHRLAHAAP